MQAPEGIYLAQGRSPLVARARVCRSEHGGNLVPPAGIEPALPKEPDFESGASTNSTTGAYCVLFDTDIHLMLEQNPVNS